MAKCKRSICQACNEPAETIHRLTSRKLCYRCFVEACQSIALADSGDEDAFKGLLSESENRSIDAETQALIGCIVLECATVAKTNPTESLRRIQ